MYFEQIVRQDIGCASYVVGSTDAGVAAVVDPRIDMVDEILEIASREGLTIRYIIETHNHADHVSGHHRLSGLTGAQIAVHKDGGAGIPAPIPLEDGQELEFGEVRLRILHTPGHRPEHIAIAAIDTTRGGEPWLVLTGDSLFIGDVARPDLAVDGKDGATALFESLHHKLMQLPEGTMVYPGHVAGSLCGARLEQSHDRHDHRLRAHLQSGADDLRQDRIRQLYEGEPAGTAAEHGPHRPAQHVGRGASACSMHQLAVDDIATHVSDGAFLLDVRSPADFAAAHIPAAINVHLDGGQFQNRVGLVFPPAARLVLVTGSDHEAHRAVDALQVIGFTNIDGYVTGGMNAGSSRASITSRRPTSPFTNCTNDSPRASLSVIDVRERTEWQDGHIDCCENVPFYKLRAASENLDRDRCYAVICAGGVRSMIAASVLQAEGFTSVLNVEGGMDAWNSAHLPTVREHAAAGVAAL